MSVCFWPFSASHERQQSPVRIRRATLVDKSPPPPLAYHHLSIRILGTLGLRGATTWYVAAMIYNAPVLKVRFFCTTLSS
ncbi:hypothetical protein D3C85_421660 [compost metagenome]